MKRIAVCVLAAVALCGPIVSTTPSTAAVNTTTATQASNSKHSGPMPLVEGPVQGGLRTGRPWFASVVDPSKLGYVEEEYFVSGTASDLGTPALFAPYTTRILVQRPADMRRFNGTVVMDWTNVSGQLDAALIWGLMHRYGAANGYIFAAVAAQKAGVDGGQQAMTGWDPQRYGKLSHPGDTYSYDIFTQAGRALASGKSGPLPFFDHRRPVQAVLASGISQGCSRLIKYIDLVEPTTRVVDGILGIGCRTALAHKDRVPVLWVNSEYESQGHEMPPDGKLIRVWEMAGASHLGWWGTAWTGFAVGRDEANVGGTTTVNPTWDPDLIGQYGQRGGGPCPQNYFPDRYVHDSALAHLNAWVLKGTAPPTAPRIASDASGNLIRDEHGNVTGGLRLPVIDVPVAGYRTDLCGNTTVNQTLGAYLFGMTVPFDPVTLQTLYGDGSYVPKMQAATDKAVAEGFLLPMDADELMQSARGSSIRVLPGT